MVSVRMIVALLSLASSWLALLVDSVTAILCPRSMGLHQSQSHLTKALDKDDDSPTVVGYKETIIDEGPEEPALYWSISAYLSYVFLVVVGYTRELIWGEGPIDSKFGREENRPGYAPLYSSFEGFYTRNIFRRYKPVVGLPMCSTPSGTVSIRNRISTDHYWTAEITPGSRRAINLASYNYLGFAESQGQCTDAVENTIRHTSGLSLGSPAMEVGRSQVSDILDQTVARFVGREAATTCGMGFATNTLHLAPIMAPVHKRHRILVLSDELNHASVILGIRLAGANVAVFRHGDVAHLESLLRTNIVQGHPRTGRPWHKIFVVVEGIYSMEGTIVKLPDILALKKKYKFYIYLDEAHSIGAMGPSGKGIVEYFDLDPGDVDVMMGTFTKSFGSAGGYIAGSRRLVDYLRSKSAAYHYAVNIAPPVAQQVVSAMEQLMDCECQTAHIRIQQLADNTRYFRQRLTDMGLIVYGDPDSPVIPILIILPSKIKDFAHKLLAEFGVLPVTVGFPAVPMTRERARFCMSAALSRSQLDKALHAIDCIADDLHLRYSRRHPVSMLG